ncbi:MAG: hypothetical protein U5Q16_17940 [Gammaproteobacteria bacterium]|nr:hypothetical protein [Gammaproteobacteria bacterium]
MTVQITIRNVPESVRAELASRAALQGKSMQDYLRGELERLVSRPSVESWIATIRECKAVAGIRVDAATILKTRKTDRR